jgi:hypothetical protein
MNGYRGGVRPMLREMARVLRDQQRALNGLPR